MADIALIDLDDALAETLAEMLSLRGDRVRRWDSSVLGPVALKDEESRPDVVVMNVSVESKGTTDCLDQLRTFRAANGPRPMILCVSRVYRGPRLEIDLERKGARFVYIW